MVPDRDTEPNDSTPTAEAGAAPFEPAPPIESRFLFVDVAAQRAKQLRRGALPRLPELKIEPAAPGQPAPVIKLERVAMEEVTRGLIPYTLPKDPGQPEGSA